MGLLRAPKASEHVDESLDLDLYTHVDSMLLIDLGAWSVQCIVFLPALWAGWFFTCVCIPFLIRDIDQQGFIPMYP